MANSIKYIRFLPDWLLRLKGKRDGKTKNEQVCTGFLEKLANMEAAFECEHVKNTENLLTGTRESAAEILKAMTILKQSIAKTADIIPGEGIHNIRSNRQRYGKFTAAEQDFKAKHLILAKLNEKITHEETLLDEDLEQVRKLCSAKMMVYLAAVRIKHADFDFPVPDFSEDKPRSIYKERHSALDAEIIRGDKYEIF